MAEIITMPKLGFNMDEGQLIKWHKKVGDTVTKGEVLFEINTDKTAMPVESTLDGVLLKILLQEGEFAPVFTPIAVVGQSGENPESALAEAAGASSPVTSGSGKAAPVPSSSVVAAPALKSGDLRLTPKAQKLIRDEGIDPASLVSVQGSGFRGGITAADIKASPLARKTAERDGIDLASVRGSGAGGKIMRADLPAVPGFAPVLSPIAGAKGIASTAPYKGVRKIIGDRLAGSKFSAPHVYFSDSVDTGRLNAFRARIKDAGDTGASVSDLLILAAGRALRRYPDLNASLEGERIVFYHSINIGLAVAGDNGLVVPVVKNVQEKRLSDIASETRDLVERAKKGHLEPEEYSGGTFTISNLGPFGIENFTAIINPPESAILAVSAVRKKAVVVGGEDGEDSIVVRPMMNIQLSVDHRIVDGLLAVNFIKYFKELLENPLRIVL
ncbi:MAG: 2-oxo acid dehydrogenase subunit E2 [Desulfovibrio sp.]|jgi:pyruvate dehydrogenase E2 component (dihydrolipoamide acetyltransferase)|nr:2-oxo acid dehydrogenase subunit E2 [Desulfovibrio sp.]